MAVRALTLALFVATCASDPTVQPSASPTYIPTAVLHERAAEPTAMPAAATQLMSVMNQRRSRTYR